MDVAQLTEDYLIGFGESLLYQSGGVLAEKSRKPTDPIYAVLLDQAQEKVEEKLGSDEYQRVIQGLNGDRRCPQTTGITTLYYVRHRMPGPEAETHADLELIRRSIKK